MLIISFPTPLELDYIILQIPFKSQRNSPLERRIFIHQTSQKLAYYRTLSSLSFPVHLLLTGEFMI